jgi:Ca-activated chloride channel homolog
MRISLQHWKRRVVPVVALCLSGGTYGQAQERGPWSALDSMQIYMDQQGRLAKEAARQRAKDHKELVDSGMVSVLDLDAPNDAVDEFNRSISLLKEQNAKEAIKHLQKAISAYPKFVSARVNLGIAYLDQSDTAHAKSEFEAAEKLDDKFPRSFVNLGMLALSQKDFAGAEAQLEQAAGLRPKDPKILTALAQAQNGNHHYLRAVETAQRVHAVEHKEMADVHYLAAIAALALNDFHTMQHELNVFLSEDPTHPLAPNARKNLEILAQNQNPTTQSAGAGGPLEPAMEASAPPQTFPNSENLKAQLNALGDESKGGSCGECQKPDEENPPAEGGRDTVVADAASGFFSGAGARWTIRTVVDEVAQYFAVSSHGKMVGDLALSDIRIQDDKKAPTKVLQFTPQSKLPLRLALLVDTSSSVEGRFSFEKRAASKFVEKMLNSASDLGFTAGFAREITVTQDFTAKPEDLGAGIEKLTNGGGTRLFDAVSFACWKLAAYPETERVARVLVILSDGEDNSSRRRLKQAIEDAESTGVTIYTVSTREGSGPKTDADKVLEVLAERSGGEAIFPDDISALGRALNKLHDLIRSRYLVAYKPADFVPNGSYRTIRIIAEKNGQRLQVHARKGYYARIEAPSK